MTGLAAAIDEVAVGPVWSLSDSLLADEVGLVYAASQRLQARLLTLVGEADGRGLAGRLGATNTASWLMFSLACSRRAASQTVELARGLASSAALETTVSALAAGSVNTEQARVIAATVRDLPDEVGAEGKSRCGKLLTELAADRVRPEVLAAHKSMILEQVAPEIAEEALRRELERAERTAYERRGLTFSKYGEGEYRVRGILPTEAAAIVRAALDPLCAPGRNLPGAADPTAAHAAAAAGLAFAPPTALGAAAIGGHAAGGLRPVGQGAIGGTRAGSIAPATGNPAAGIGLAGGDGSGDVTDPQAIAARDPRSPAARRADALTELCRRALAHGDLPDNGGEKPHLVLTMSWQQLRDATAGGLLDTGDQLTPAAARQLACDALIIPAVLGGHGQPLDLGRARRLIDGPLRRALVLRDRGCAFPGCERPPEWCNGHHIRSWADGGPTSLANAVLLCGHHHRVIHRGEWIVQIGPDDYPEFTPPHYIDRERRPVRNNLHRRS
jgi:Domain of unknown function (DUF222)/HNH endonuclease